MKWIFLAAPALVTIAACSLIKTSDLSCGSETCIERAPSPALDDAGALDAASRDSGSGPAGVDACTGSSCPSACPGGIVYVSSKGSDTYDGCNGALPLATIGAALARAAVPAAADSGTAPEIHVCAGSYNENLAPITTSVRLLGGYNCTSWKQTAGYGYPTFDAINETRLGAAGTGGGSGATVTFETAAVDPGAVLDGFTVLLSTSLVPQVLTGFGTVGDAYGVLAVDNAAPTITNVHVSAGTTNASRSIGIAAEHATAQVMNNLVEAGNGQHGIGVYILDSSAPGIIQNNTVHGGAATSTTSEGIEVSTSQPFTGDFAIRGNDVEGGAGAAGSIGILVTNTTATVADNVVSGGAPPCGTSCLAYGILVRTTTNAFLADSNRIVGTTGSGVGVGIVTATTSSAVITNNVIFGSVAAGTSAIVLDGGDHAVIRHNTLTSAGPAVVASKHPGATIENNLAVAFTTPSFFLSSDDCTSGSPTTFLSIAGNGAVGYEGQLLIETGTCATPVGTGLAGLAAHFGDVVGTNVRLDDSCSDESAATTPFCSATTACAASVSACGASVVASIDSSSDAIAAALDPTRGYPLAATAPCLVTQGGADRTSSVPLDVLGATRTAPVSIGAYEDDATCQ